MGSHQEIRVSRPASVRIIAGVLFAMFSSQSALAITNGQPDGNGHPAVGGLVSPKQYSDGTWIYCTGTLIAPSVFLTAAHCDIGLGRVSVTFSANYHEGDKTYFGSYIPDPRFTHKQGDPHDIAVVLFEQPVTGITPARLPAANSLSGLRQGQPFTSVGFGAYLVTRGPGGHQYLYSDSRNVSVGTLSAINKAWLRISQNASTGDGGTCYGDSGGPNFLGSTNIVAGITVTGDAQCGSRNVDYRLDTTDARDFLSWFLPLP